MTGIQLDENIDSERLVKLCAKSAVRVVRFPRDLKTKEAREKKLNKDPLVLPRLFATGNPLLTTDLPIYLGENTSVIPDQHPGIIIIGNPKPTPTARFSDIVKTIEYFKSQVPHWHALPWENSIAEITLKWVEVRYIASGRVQGEAHIDFSDGAWPQKLAAILAANSQRLAMPKLN
jgi:hypothetical protein